MSSENVITITTNNFESEVLNSTTPVLIDFWATWCGPCRMLGPVIDEIASDYIGKAKVGKLNVDEQSELAIKYSVMTIPTVIIFKNGAIVEKLVGARPKKDFTNLLDSSL